SHRGGRCARWTRFQPRVAAGAGRTQHAHRLRAHRPWCARARGQPRRALPQRLRAHGPCELAKKYLFQPQRRRAEDVDGAGKALTAETVREDPSSKIQAPGNFQSSTSQFSIKAGGRPDRRRLTMAVGTTADTIKEKLTHYLKACAND